MTDKNSNNHSPKDKNKFFDVSFDEPAQDDNSDFKESDFVSQSQANKPDGSIEKSNKSDYSNIMINRSFNRVQNLFNETNLKSSDDYKQIKSAKGKNLADRAKLSSFHSTSSAQKNFTTGNQSTDNQKVTSELNQADSLNDFPTPEQLARERDRRRQLRLEKLNDINSSIDQDGTDQINEEQLPNINSKNIEIAKNIQNSTDEVNQLDDLTNVDKNGKVHDEQILQPPSTLSMRTSDSIKYTHNGNKVSSKNNSHKNDRVDELSSFQRIEPTQNEQNEAKINDTNNNYHDDLAVVIHNNNDNDLDLETIDEPVQSEDNYKPKGSKKRENKDKYSLKGLSNKEKTFFGLNVTFNVIKKLLIYIIIIVIFLGVLAGGAGIGYFANLVSQTAPPTEQQMREQINQLEQQSTLYYGSGELIADVRTDIVRSIASLNDISPYITDGLIATEDEHFEEHKGIVPKAILRAVIETLLNGAGTGGSTLTQQLVKQQMLSNDVTFFRKANEMLLALRLENYFSKEEILTAYLNVSPFGRNNKGDNIAGITAASEGIFGVSPNEVSLPQAAFLIGLPQDPYTYTPYEQTGELREPESIQYGVERMKEVLFRMYRDKKITREEYEEASAYNITRDFLKTETRPVERQTYLYQAIMNGAIEKIMLLNIQDDGYTWQQVFSDDDWYNEYYFAAEEQLRTGGYKVYSTIDKEIYEQLNASAQAYEDQLGAVYDGVYTDPETGHETYYIERVQTGLVAIDNNSGRVLGFVAGTDYENNQIDHAFNMRRSPGSTIKPLAVYGPAVENNLITPSTIIPDTSFVREYDDGSVWEPTNYGTVVSDSFMTARTALYRSDNIPAVRIYEELINQGVHIINYLEKMGFNTVDSYTEDDTLLLPFSLGGVSTGPTVFEQTRAFSTFANNGQYVDGYYIERIEDAFGNTVFQQSKTPEQVFSEDTNYIMVDMLRDTFTEGTGRTANEYMEVPGDWIAKSGISENSKDIWFIASTPSITIGSWIGYDSRFSEYTIDVNDGFDRESVRSQIYWARIVNDLYALRPEIFGTSEVFNQPSSVREQTVLEQTGTLPGNFTYNGSHYQLTGPTKNELFKVSNPAPALTFDFMLGASEEDLNRFWNSVRSQQLEQQSRQSTQQTEPTDSNPENDESGESDSTDNAENTDENADEPTEETPVESSES
ncbi:transglycosylase domain-containing protein [Aerococcaceae bacterium WGS1372]